MSTVNPTYSKEPGREVFHNNNKCTERNNIETHNLRQGTDGRRLCHRCAELNEEGKK